MKVPQIKSALTSNACRKTVKRSRETAKRLLAKEKNDALLQEIEKRRVLADKELKILPEYNFFGLPKWM